ncbi:MFS transporter [Caldalkalibacillus mannanilyticus]|uniref:MFS transporter n=1 Tax=Caldalkalibacillus mannanilyticus TaxID=1418 RepID=UPI0006876B81|nr:MFS transporter [Caldalkalibacillus mannanilyticus]
MKLKYPSKTWFGEKKYAWFIMSFLWLYGFIGAATRFVLAYYQIDITNELGVNRSFIAFTWSLNMVVVLIFTSVGGWLTDRYGPKKLMIVSALFTIIGDLIIVLFQNSIAFLVGFGLILGLIGIASTTNYILVLTWFTQHRAKAMTIISSAQPLGLAS